MGNVVYGIKEAELGALSMEILDYKERISKILSRIDASMDQLPGCYQGSPCEALAKRYQALRVQYPVLKRNIKSYSDDLITLIHKMHENDRYLSKLFQEFTDDNYRLMKAEKLKLK